MAKTDAALTCQCCLIPTCVVWTNGGLTRGLVTKTSVLCPPNVFHVPKAPSGSHGNLSGLDRLPANCPGTFGQPISTAALYAASTRRTTAVGVAGAVTGFLGRLRRLGERECLGGERLVAVWGLCGGGAGIVMATRHLPRLGSGARSKVR